MRLMHVVLECLARFVAGLIKQIGIVLKGVEIQVWGESLALNLIAKCLKR